MQFFHDNLIGKESAYVCRSQEETKTPIEKVGFARLPEKIIKTNRQTKHVHTLRRGGKTSSQLGEKLFFSLFLFSLFFSLSFFLSISIATHGPMHSQRKEVGKGKHHCAVS